MQGFIFNVPQKKRTLEEELFQLKILILTPLSTRTLLKFDNYSNENESFRIIDIIKDEEVITLIVCLPISKYPPAFRCSVS